MIRFREGHTCTNPTFVLGYILFYDHIGFFVYSLAATYFIRREYKGKDTSKATQYWFGTYVVLVFGAIAML